MSYVEETTTKVCGCKSKEYYNDDPEFSGYDSDRLEVKTVYCEEHKKELKRLEKERNELYEKLSIIEKSVKRIRNFK